MVKIKLSHKKGQKSMVKGVNKTVIEVNNTGNKFFEKIVFYVTPEYGNLSAKQLRLAAENFSFSFSEKTENKNNNSFRKRYNKKRRRRITVLVGGAVAVLGIILAVIL